MSANFSDLCLVYGYPNQASSCRDPFLRDHIGHENERSNESKRDIYWADSGQQSSHSSRSIIDADVEAESMWTHLLLVSKSSFNDGMVEI